MDHDSIIPQVQHQQQLPSEGDTKGNILAAVESLDPKQQTYLGAISQKRRESLALHKACVDPPTLRRWREDPTFAMLEDVVKAQAWGIGKSLAIALADAKSPALVQRLADDAQDSQHSLQARVAAADRVLQVAGAIGSRVQASSVTQVNIGNLTAYVARPDLFPGAASPGADAAT